MIGLWIVWILLVVVLLVVVGVISYLCDVAPAGIITRLCVAVAVILGILTGWLFIPYIPGLAENITVAVNKGTNTEAPPPLVVPPAAPVAVTNFEHMGNSVTLKAPLTGCQWVATTDGKNEWKKEGDVLELTDGHPVTLSFSRDSQPGYGTELTFDPSAGSAPAAPPAPKPAH
jgi:hypothetical protein